MWSAMTWNVLFGGEDRFARVLDVVTRARPDVLVLQECVGWEDGVRLAEIARALGLDPRHAYLGEARPRGSGRRFHVALFSRFTMRTVTTHADPALVGHAIVEATLAAPGGDVVVFGTHFDSHGEDERLRDARTLCSLIDSARVSDERVLVAGDLNALSPRDPYPADLAALLRAAGTQKYGDPPRFDVMPLLEKHGLSDLLYGAQPPAEWVTARRDRGGVRIDYRTDYLLASPPLALACVQVEVLACEGASDHEPVVARFQ